MAVPASVPASSLGAPTSNRIRELHGYGVRGPLTEYRDRAIWGNPYFRVLRSQLEAHIQKVLGEDYLTRAKNQTELRRVNKGIADLNKRLSSLQDRKKELEASLDKGRNTEQRAAPDGAKKARRR